MEILPSRQFPVLEMPANLKCQLMQYQNKTVSWCLSMENPNVKYEKVQVLWENISGQYVNRYTKAVKETNPEESLSGGILADEMGLGKTLMMLALMLLNKCQFKDFKKAGEYPYLLDSNPHQTLVPLHSTLIITPSAILYQWESEIQKHTTGVKVMVFKAGISDLQISDLEKYDIILASYDDLRKEFYASLQKSDRKLRKKPKIQVRKSLLNGILWWRVVMDEVQMVKNGVSNAAKMARCIPRIHSWGVSGTPFGKNGYNDLLNLLNFVDQESVILQNDTWRYLMENQEMMMDFLKRIMHRNLKDLVKNELVLSSQTESKIFLNLSPVENYYYNELLKKCKEEIKNIDSERQKDLENGVAPKVSVLSRLRMWLLQLRQTCCNLQIGTHNQNVLGSNLRTMGQVLKTLVDQTSAKAYSHHRMIVIDRIQLAQVHEFRGHFEQALSIYESVLKEIPPAFQAIGLEISEETDRRVKLKALPDSDLSKKVDLRDNQDLISMLKMRLDLWLELKHRTLFFMAACYHAMASYSEESQEPQYPEYAEKENMYYKYATGVRREILGADESNIKLLNDQIYSFSDSIAKEIRGPKNEFLIYLPSDKYKGGIRFAALFEKVQVLSENLNEQWQLIDEWRFSIIQLVTKPLEDAQEKTEGDLVDPSGEEYAEGLDNQEKLITLVNCYRRLLYDRIVLLTGFRNESGDHDHESSIISGRYANSDYKNDHYFAPLDSKRLQFSPAKDEKGLRVLISQMLAFSKRTDVPKLELKMADCAYKEFVDLYDLQQKIMRKLEMELNNISDLMVHRRDYYSRLQKLSDGVVPLNRPENVDILESVIKTRLDETQVEFASIAGRKRYLEHLLNEEKKDGNNKKDMECGICRGGMEKQSILPCGHYFCNGCLFAWLSRHRKCPVCNQKASIDDVETFLSPNSEVIKRRKCRSNPEFDSFLELLSSINLPESFGTKLDTIVRHIIHLKTLDPLVKVLIFSQWEQVLELLTKSLDLNHISWIRMEHNHKMHKGKAVVEFQNNATLTAFLLNSKSQSSGLTLVAASHVFIVEPILSGLDQQAINRVHRIGQTKPTFVWRYIINDTVEERIWEMLESNVEKNHSWLENEAEERGDEVLRRTIGL